MGSSVSVPTEAGETDEESLQALDHSHTTVLMTCFDFFQRGYYNGTLRYVPATIFSLGKIAQAAGQDILGINKILEDFGSTNPYVNDGLLAFLVSINLFITISTRADKIFEYCLLAKVYWVEDLSAIEAHVDISKSYVLDARTQRLYKVDIEPSKRNEVSLSAAGKALLNALFDRIQTELLESDLGVRPWLVSEAFNAQYHSQLSDILRHHSFPEDWQWPAKRTFDVLYIFCAISTFFAGMAAYLSGVTLAQLINVKINAKLGNGYLVAMGTYVAVCAVMAYLSFNLDTMRRFVTRFCSSLNEGLHKGDYGIPVRVMQWTVAMTFLGVFASAGMAYFVAKNSTAIFPWVKHWSNQEKDILIFSNVVVSFFPSIFNFASGCYSQLLNASKTHGAAHPTRITAVTGAIGTSVLIDSIANCFGTFIGTRDLLEVLFNGQKSPFISQIILGVAIIAASSNAFLNYGMTMTGTEDTFKKWNDYFYGPGDQEGYVPLLAAQTLLEVDSIAVAPGERFEGGMGGVVANTPKTEDAMLFIVSVENPLLNSNV